MQDANAMTEARVRALAAGLGEADLEWLDRLAWNDAAIPDIRSDDQLADYRRREAALNRSVAHLTFAERAESPEGKLAAALGAAAANWSDRDEDG